MSGPRRRSWSADPSDRRHGDLIGLTSLLQDDTPFLYRGRLAMDATGQGPGYSARAEITQAAARARLYLSSYAALFGILAVRFDGLVLRLACAGLFAVGTADTFRITLKTKSGLVPYEIKVTSSEDTGGEVSGYLASYLLPFVTVPTPGWRDLLAYGLFLLVGLVIYVRSNLVRVNPTLYLLGYRVLHVHYGAHREQFLVTRVVPAEGQTVTVCDVAGVLLDGGGTSAHG